MVVVEGRIQHNLAVVDHTGSIRHIEDSSLVVVGRKRCMGRRLVVAERRG